MAAIKHFKHYSYSMLMSHQSTELIKASMLAVDAATILEKLSVDLPNDYFALRNELCDVRNKLEACVVKLDTLFKDLGIFGSPW